MGRQQPGALGAVAMGFGQPGVGLLHQSPGRQMVGIGGQGPGQQVGDLLGIELLDMERVGGTFPPSQAG